MTTPRFKRGLALAFILSLISFHTINAFAAHPDTSEERRTHIDVIDPTVKAGIIKALRGEVLIKKAGADEEKAATVGEGVDIGDFIITYESGRAELEMIDASVIRIGKNSKLKIDEYLFDGESRKSAVMKLFRGKLRSLVDSTGGGSFKVRTSTAVGGVRGTDFFTYVERGETTVMVLEGLVEVYNPYIPEMLVSVNPCYATTVRKGVAPSVLRRVTKEEQMRHILDTVVEPKEKDESTAGKESLADDGKVIYEDIAAEELTAQAKVIRSEKGRYFDGKTGTREFGSKAATREIAGDTVKRDFGSDSFIRPVPRPAGAE